tara:strand:+ start:385 stop:723 length:339 start_codon:yes stop_codon:yes gene_type:complete
MGFTKIVNTGIGTITDPFSVPSGPTSERPGTPTEGMIRYNTQHQQYEAYTNHWSSFGNATGAGGNRVFFEGDINVTNSYTITTGRNAMSAGPITLDSNVVVTIPAGSVWTVV